MALQWYVLKLTLGILFYKSYVSSKTQVKITDEEYALMPELFYLDNFDNCMVYGEKALYCTFTAQLTPKDVHSKSKVWNIIKAVSDYPRNYRHDLLRHGICIPKTCPSIDVGTYDEEQLKHSLSECYTSKYHNLSLKAEVFDLHCETKEPFYPIDNFDKGVAIGFGILLALVVLSTFYEGFARYKTKEQYEKMISTPVGRFAVCFSLPANWARLKKDNTVNAFKSINGFRFYNTILVIMIHVSMVCFASPVQNPTFLETLTLKPKNMLFVNGSCAIQTFFLITGYLISYNFLLLFEKHKELKKRYLILAFVNRYIRLTACLIVMIAFNSSWIYHISRGPIWNTIVGTEYRNCRKNWWLNLLYINNIYDANHICMQHTWYLATDTQMFLMALIVVAFMWKYQHRIKLILSIALTVGVVMPIVINYYNNFDIVVRQYPETLYSFFLNSTEWHTIYASPFTNFGAYAMGMVFGYLAYVNAKTNRKLFTSKVYLTIWWILVWGLPLGVIYYGIFIYQEDYEYTRLGAAIYVSLHKNLFALGICFGIYGITENIGWLLRDCVMWPPVQVLGRLTYSTYLVHVAFTRVRGGQATTPIYLSDYGIVTHTIGDAAVSFILGLLFALLVELPVTALQKLMVPQLSAERFESSIKSNEGYINNNIEINKKIQ